MDLGNSIETQECHILAQSGSGWHRIGQIWDFVRSAFRTVPISCKLMLKIPRFISFRANITSVGDVLLFIYSLISKSSPRFS